MFPSQAENSSNFNEPKVQHNYFYEKNNKNKKTQTSFKTNKVIKALVEMLFIFQMILTFFSFSFSNTSVAKRIPMKLRDILEIALCGKNVLLNISESTCSFFFLFFF